MIDNNNGEWAKSAKYVLKSLDELKKHYEESENKIDANREAFMKAVNNLELTVVTKVGELRSDIKVIQTKMNQKAAMWGIIAGLIPASITFIFTLIKLSQIIIK